MIVGHDKRRILRSRECSPFPDQVQGAQCKIRKESTLKSIEQWSDDLTELYKKNRDKYRRKKLSDVGIA
jgi:hypothetical protein